MSQARIEKKLTNKLAQQGSNATRRSDTAGVSPGIQHGSMVGQQKEKGVCFTSVAGYESWVEEMKISSISESDLNVVLSDLDLGPSVQQVHVEPPPPVPSSHPPEPDNSGASSLIPPTVCSICFETSTSPSSWYACHGCKASACPACLEQILQRATREGRPLTCFNVNVGDRPIFCSHPIPHPVALAIVGPEQMVS